MKNYLSILSKIISALIVFYIFVKEIRYLTNSGFILGNFDNKTIGLNDELIIYYLRLLFSFLALPIFTVAKVLEFFNFISSDDIHYYHVNLFYNSVYFIMTFYMVLVAVDKLF